MDVRAWTSTQAAKHYCTTLLAMTSWLANAYTFRKASPQPVGTFNPETTVGGYSILIMSLHHISWNVNMFHCSGTHGPRKMILTQATAYPGGEHQCALAAGAPVVNLLDPRCEKVLPRQSHSNWEPSICEHGRNNGVCTSIGTSLLSCVFKHGSLVLG